MTSMHKVDSFLKEASGLMPLAQVGIYFQYRYFPSDSHLAIASLVRKALKDYTFSDGTFIPKGALIAAAAHPTHLDDAIYPNASTFDGFRFSDIREKAGQDITTNQFVATNPDYVPFGHAKHAWYVCYTINLLKCRFDKLVIS